MFRSLKNQRSSSEVKTKPSETRRLSRKQKWLSRLCVHFWQRSWTLSNRNLSSADFLVYNTNNLSVFTLTSVLCNSFHQLQIEATESQWRNVMFIFTEKICIRMFCFCKMKRSIKVIINCVKWLHLKRVKYSYHISKIFINHSTIALNAWAALLFLMIALNFISLIVFLTGLFNKPD